MNLPRRNPGFTWFPEIGVPLNHAFNVYFTILFWDTSISGHPQIWSPQAGQNVNVLVLDTEGYSNTGAQNSKATPKARPQVSGMIRWWEVMVFLTWFWTLGLSFKSWDMFFLVILQWGYHSLVGGLVAILYFPIYYWECHHPNWLIYVRGVQNINQFKNGICLFLTWLFNGFENSVKLQWLADL